MLCYTFSFIAFLSLLPLIKSKVDIVEVEIVGARRLLVTSCIGLDWARGLSPRSEEHEYDVWELKITIC